MGETLIDRKWRIINNCTYACRNPGKQDAYVKTLLFLQRHVEFRYDLGSGPALLRSLQTVTLDSWHRIQAKRWHRDGMLKLDEHETVDGQSQGTLR